MTQPSSTKGAGLLKVLGKLKDFRRAQGKRHPLQIILLMIIMAIMGGAKTERAIARFVKNNKDSLIKALKIKRKEVPGRTVIQSVIQHVDFGSFQTEFRKWASQKTVLNPKDFVGIDGKSIRGTVKNGQNNLQSFISLVSAFAVKASQVLAVKNINTKKESEIPAVCEIIELLDLEGVTYTMDALHAQTKTLNAIVKNGNHYIVGIKGNQPGLLKNMQALKKSDIGF